MARREPDPPHDADPLKGGLKHNPFAALRPAGASTPPKATPESTPNSTPKPAPKSARPSPKPIASNERVTVRRERSGHGGKTVTIAEGPGFAGRKLDELAREIARGFGTGARVEGATIAVQGDQRERLVEWLTARGFVQVALGN